MSMWLVPSLDAGGGMRVQRRRVSVSHGAFVVQQLAKTPSQPSTDRSCRIAWDGSKGEFSSGTGALGEHLSLGGLPEKEMAAHPSTARIAEAAAALLAESWDIGCTGEL